VTTLSKSDQKMSPEDWAASIPLFSDEHSAPARGSGPTTLREQRSIPFKAAFSRRLGIKRNLRRTHDQRLAVPLGDGTGLCLFHPAGHGPARRGNLTLYLQAVGKYIDTILCRAPILARRRENSSIRAYSRSSTYPHALMNDYVHQHSDAKTMYHSCGSNFNLMEHFIAAGIDILNPIQNHGGQNGPSGVEAALWPTYRVLGRRCGYPNRVAARHG